MENASCVSKSLPFVAMLVMSFVVNGSVTVSKSAMSSGLSPYVQIVYFNALGNLILLPWFVCHCLRGKRLPITFPILCRFFGLSLIGMSLSPICIFTGLKYTSVTVGAAIANLTPIFTYLIAICWRMESLDLRKFTDQMKAFGTSVAVLGAFVVTLYKGPALLAADDASKSDRTLVSEHSNWQLGCLFFTVGYLQRAMWNICQADTVKLYPDAVTTIFVCSLFGTIQAATISSFLVKGQDAWKLHLKIEIIAIVYAAVSFTVLTNTVLIWCLSKKGPLFVTMFDPLGVAIAAAMGFVFLADGLYLGSVVGSAIIIVGFYAVMWGQMKTTSPTVNKIGGLESATSHMTPLLQNSAS